MKVTLVIAGVTIALLAVAGYLVVRHRPHEFARVYAWWHEITIEANREIAMRDGTLLAVDVLRPRRPAQRLPTILVRTPYMKESMRGVRGDAMRFAQRGFAVVVQDMRGRYGSGGEFAPYSHSAEDGADTLDWIIEQPWSNGKVGSWGCSALGESQLILAAGRHPALRAIGPQSAGGGVGRAGRLYSYFGIYEGGVLTLSSAAGWFAGSGAKRPPSWRGHPITDADALTALPSIDVVKRLVPFTTDYEFMVATPLGDSAWDRLGYVKPEDRFSAPGLHVTSWFDQASAAGIAAARLLSKQASAPEAAQHQHLIIGPGEHCSTGQAGHARVGEIETPGGTRQLFDLWVRWYQHWLSGEQSAASVRPDLLDLPPVQYYVMREDRWAQADQWPPAGTRIQRWFLDSDGGANSRSGDGRLLSSEPLRPAVDRFTYDPARPVPTVGGAFCCTGNPADETGPVDQALVERRDDVLVYTSEPLLRDTRIVGPIAVVLHVTTSARDTDFTSKLVDVRPDGSAVNIRDGVLRLRYRNGIDRPELAIAGTRYRIRIELGDIAWLLPAGDRLRVQVSSSNFPRLERNLNTGGRNFDEVQGVVATNEVLHSSSEPSWLELAVLE